MTSHTHTFLFPFPPPLPLHSTRLAACCGDDQSCVCVFEVLNGHQLCNQKVNDDDTYTAATFFGDSRKLAFGGLKGQFYVMVRVCVRVFALYLFGYHQRLVVISLAPTYIVSDLISHRSGGCIQFRRLQWLGHVLHAKRQRSSPSMQ